MQATALHGNMSPFSFYLQQVMYFKHQQNMIFSCIAGVLCCSDHGFKRIFVPKPLSSKFYRMAGRSLLGHSW